MDLVIWLQVQKRKFYAWAGKRGDSSEDTREADELDAEAGRADKKKFYSWAGKRSDEETPNDEELEKPSDKR